MVSPRYGAALLLVLSLGLTSCGPDAATRRREASAAQQMAYAYMQEKQPTKALQELSKAEALLPEDAEIKNTMGLTLWAKREFPTAERKFLEAVTLDPEYSEAWNNLGAFYIDQGRYQEAVNALEKALANVLYATSERALTNLGWALFKLGRVDEAKAKLTEAAEGAPTFALAQKNLGLVLQESGDQEGALARFDRTLKLYSADQETHFAKGVSLLKLGRKAEAKVALEEAWRLGPSTELGKSAATYVELLK